MPPTQTVMIITIKEFLNSAVKERITLITQIATLKLSFCSEIPSVPESFLSELLVGRVELLSSFSMADMSFSSFSVLLMVCSRNAVSD